MLIAASVQLLGHPLETLFEATALHGHRLVGVPSTPTRAHRLPARQQRTDGGAEIEANVVAVGADP